MSSEIKVSCLNRSMFAGLILLLLLLLSVISLIGMDNKFTTVPSSREITYKQVHFKFEDTFGDLSNTRHNDPLDPKNSFGRRRRGKNYLLIYNNVPKTGSRTLSQAIRDSLKKHKPRIESTIMPRTIRSNIQEITTFLMELDAPFFVQGHSPFVRLHRSNVLHINVVRDPVERFVSGFYFSQNGDNSGLRPPIEKSVKQNITVDEYIQNKNDIYAVQSRLSRFFLSNASEDEERNVQIAKQNIEKYYSLVGITEEIDQVTTLLQQLFPDLLPGLNDFYRNNNAKRQTSFTTIGKVPPSAETVAMLKKEMKYDYDLYEYIKGRFHDLRNEFQKKNV